MQQLLSLLAQWLEYSVHKRGVASLSLTIGSVISVEYPTLLFISLGSPLVTPEMDILQLTKGFLIIEKIERK